MILQVVKNRLGFAITIAAGAVLVSVVTGGSVVAAAVAAAAAVGLLGAVFARRDRRSPEQAGQANREPGEPWSFAYTWTVDGPINIADVYNQLREEGSATDLESRSEGRIVAVGGSQFRSRLFGGYFVDPKHLPVRITLEATPNADGSTVLDVEIRDRFGIAIRDGALEGRYVQAAEDIRRIAERRPE